MKKVNWVSWLALILSIISIGNSFYTHKEFINETAIGVVIAALTILVTILIGWNIWSVYDSKKQLDAFSRELVENRQFIENQFILLNTQMHTSLYQFYDENINGNEGRYFIEGVLSLSYLLRMGDKTTASHLAKRLISNLEGDLPGKIKPYDKAIIIATTEKLIETIDEIPKIKHLTKKMLSS